MSGIKTINGIYQQVPRRGTLLARPASCCALSSERSFQSGREIATIACGLCSLVRQRPAHHRERTGSFRRPRFESAIEPRGRLGTIRDKIFFGELDAAHALAPMVFAARLGLKGPPTECVAALVLNLHGNAITLSRSLADAARIAGGLGAFV